MQFDHKPVMPSECINALKVTRGGIFADLTIGGGGHSEKILEKLGGSGKLIGVDKDQDALDACKQRFEGQKNIILLKSDFKDAAAAVENAAGEPLDGVLIDLGVSSYQLDNPERGFSYIADAPLDMRMDKSAALTAKEVVNTYTLSRLSHIIRTYGEDKFAQNIAKSIVQARQDKPLETTAELAALIDKSIPYSLKKTGGHPAKRTFMALRIEVNGELDRLEEAVNAYFKLLKPGGRIAVLTFHSLEDRIIKNVFAELCTGCICDKSLPKCVCGKVEAAKPVTRKPQTAAAAELTENPRSKSAKLRVIEKIQHNKKLTNNPYGG